jgi:biopolymer transport protein ExbD
MSWGFIDLRQNQGASNTGDHFWPSFTDIMTVIVMIFMLASVVLVIKNWELLENLRQSMEAEQEVSESLRIESEENATLEEQLAQAQHQLSMMRMQLMQAQESNELQAEMVRSLSAEKQGLSDRLLLAEEQLQKSAESYENLQQQFQAQIVMLEGLRGQVLTLEADNKQQSERIASLQAEDQQNQQQLIVLKGDYDSLKTKYDKLVRPARSPKGKYVVEVRYRKVDGKPRIQFRDQGQAEPVTVTRKELDQRLAALQKKDPLKLYIKIIIPADSGLSYAEAWKFMKATLEKYDYYHQ